MQHRLESNSSPNALKSVGQKPWRESVSVQCDKVNVCDLENQELTYSDAQQNVDGYRPEDHDHQKRTGPA